MAVGLQNHDPHHSNLLKQLGFQEIDDASDGAQALAKMQERKYGLVISDRRADDLL